MVYCTRCGTENDDDKEYCKNCGASLRTQTRRKRFEDEMCFGVPMQGYTWGLIFGLMIVLWGVSELVGVDFNLWALIAIVFGGLMVWNSIKYSREA